MVSLNAFAFLLSKTSLELNLLGAFRVRRARSLTPTPPNVSTVAPTQSFEGLTLGVRSHASSVERASSRTRRQRASTVAHSKVETTLTTSLLLQGMSGSIEVLLQGSQAMLFCD